ncbi:MAG TPA: class I SAM-dependent methyltransferase [Ktedonobacterales bacterium]|jgi:demethylmenaquinone methyltransferase/2-methoxy-6-polyprenyl-1,4-benzoquinol methylase
MKWTEQVTTRRKSAENDARISDVYRKLAKGYDKSGIAALESWRKEAIKRLNLRHGDQVVDIGCGTGLNFALLQKAVGETGRIIGVDLTDAMLDQARLRVERSGWKNVELVHCNAAHYQFPAQVDGILSAFALTFIPEARQVIQNGCQALAPGRRWVVLDMAWPHRWPWWLHHLLFFLRLPSYGITREVVRRRPWQTSWRTMEQHLVEVGRQSFWMGFFYLAWGKQPF